MLSKALTSQTFLLSLLFSVAFAAPFNEPVEAGLVARAGDGSEPGKSKSNPKNAEFDISNWEDISEEDCYAILCLKGGERTWWVYQSTQDSVQVTNWAIHRQRVDTSSTRERHYRESGAKSQPFRKDQVSKRRTAQINSDPGKTTETNSAEEFPWESMTDGGPNALLFPATRDQQDRMLHCGLCQGTPLP